MADWHIFLRSSDCMLPLVISPSQKVSRKCAHANSSSTPLLAKSLCWWKHAWKSSQGGWHPWGRHNSNPCLTQNVWHVTSTTDFLREPERARKAQLYLAGCMYVCTTYNVVLTLEKRGPKQTGQTFRWLPIWPSHPAGKGQRCSQTRQFRASSRGYRPHHRFGWPSACCTCSAIHLTWDAMLLKLTIAKTWDQARSCNAWQNAIASNV